MHSGAQAAVAVVKKRSALCHHVVCKFVKRHVTLYHRSALGRAFPPLVVALVVTLAGACSFPVQGEFMGRELPLPPERTRTILVIYNHGFTSETAGTYRPQLPPILQTLARRNPDVVVFSQVRNTSRLDAVHHMSYIEAAIEHFHRQQGIPLGNIVLAGQSCGGWGSLQAAAYSYPQIGGVVAFAPTCHGRLPHSTQTRMRRLQEIEQLARRARFPGLIFLYEGDSYYDVDDWAGFHKASGLPADGVHIVRLGRDAVLRVCARCTLDSHGVVWDRQFDAAYYESEVQPLVERVRERIRAAAGPR